MRCLSIDKASPTDVIQINRPGGVDGNYTEFQAGESFFEGRNPNHVLVFDNLVFEQMRWDDQNIYYYINDEGEVVLRVNTRYTYPEGTASDHLPFGTNATGYAG